MKETFYKVYIDAVADVGTNSTGIGIIIVDKNGKTILTNSDFIDKNDLNRAISEALKKALREMRRRKASCFTICSDSEVFIRKLQGIYQIRDPILKQLRNAINKKFQDVDIEIKQVSLEENRQANQLAKKGIEKVKMNRNFGMNPLSMQDDTIRPPTEDEPVQKIQCSAGGVLYKREGEKFKICIIAKRDFKVWALPKGRVAEGETPEETAVREVIEETGHLGNIEAKIDQIDYHFYWKDNDTMYHKFVYFYLMPLEKEDAAKRDEEADAVRWVTLGEAYKMVTYINEKEVIRKARKILAQA